MHIIVAKPHQHRSHTAFWSPFVKSATTFVVLSHLKLYETKEQDLDELHQISLWLTEIV